MIRQFFLPRICISRIFLRTLPKKNPMCWIFFRSTLNGIHSYMPTLVPTNTAPSASCRITREAEPALSSTVDVITCTLSQVTRFPSVSRPASQPASVIPHDAYIGTCGIDVRNKLIGLGATTLLMVGGVTVTKNGHFPKLVAPAIRSVLNKPANHPSFHPFVCPSVSY